MDGSTSDGVRTLKVLAGFAMVATGAAASVCEYAGAESAEQIANEERITARRVISALQEISLTPIFMAVMTTSRRLS